MSDLSGLLTALAEKANELVGKGYLLRAAENVGRAAEVAHAWGEDNLIALNMQMRQGDVLCGYAITASLNTTADPRILAGHRAEGVALLSGAVEALERRRVAGTLLEGKCMRFEQAWRTCQLRQLSNASGLGPRYTADEADSWAALVGYEQFLEAAINIFNLAYADLFAAECSTAQFQRFTQHVVHAAELMQQPRRHGDAALDIEAALTKPFRVSIGKAAANGLDARLVQLLAGAWQQVQRSGVLEARRIDEYSGSIFSAEQTALAAIRNSLLAPDLRSCALPGCSTKEAHPTHFKSCAACRTVVYCCREHQVAGWPSHKKACKAARKAQAEEDGAGPSDA